MMPRLPLLSLLLALAYTSLLAADETKEETPFITTGTWKHEELKRFKAPEANQGVAADDEHIYVITNRAVGKYRKDTLKRVGGWKDENGGPFIHLNAGIIHDGKLLCAHSNFPGTPMTSSIEIFDPQTMTHIGSHSLGIDSGSLTWITWHGGHWYACFAHYSKSQPATGRDPAWTELVRFDTEWRRTGGWVFPKLIIEIFGTSSSSGGSISADGTLFITGHDARQLFVLRFPKAGSVLEWTDTIPITAAGQAFVWDPVQPGTFYSILRKSKEVIISKITPPPAPSH
jgi:outer membrane protein assembly factor BamB